MRSVGVGSSDVGQQRTGNEDAFLVDNDLGLYVVCDGMGGCAAGEIASRRAVEGLRQIIVGKARLVRRLWEQHRADSEVARFVEDAVQQVCAEIHRLAASNPQWGGMGTTMTMLLVLGERAVMGHVGDSRLYVVRDERVWQLSSDHTISRSLTQMGLLKPEQENEHHMSHVLTRALGTQKAVAVDTLVFELLPNDRCLLCTDGLTAYIHSPEEIEDLVSGRDLPTCATELVQLANSRGGRDNITVVVVEFKAEDPADPVELERTRNISRMLCNLRTMFLFGDLPPRDLLRLQPSAVVRTAPAGDLLTRQGEPPEYYALVLSGTVALYDGVRQVGTRKPGDTFGVEAMIKGHPAATTAQAAKAVRFLAVPASELAVLLEQHPRMGVRVYRRLCQQLLSQLENGY